MSRDRHQDDSIYRHCITWNVPAIRRSGNEDAIAFVETLQLLPSRFGEPATDANSRRMPPLRRAALGLQAEISGDLETARDHYDRIGRLPGVRGVLGRLLIAWMADATLKDFDQVEERLHKLKGPGVSDLLARSHSRLASWALDRGWPDTAGHHFDQARQLAGKELQPQLEQIGHWFGRNQRIYFSVKSGDMVRFPWIVDFIDEAARKSVEAQFKQSFKSPWTRTWTFGSLSTEGTDIQSAEMQASWAGALWLMPTIQRQHAALILEKSREPSDISRAIALWVRGRGSDAGQLVRAFEGHLTADSVFDLLINKLHSGRSVTLAKSWLDACNALWSELPETMVEDMVAHYSGPPPGLRRHTDEAARLSLFTKVMARSQSGAMKLESFTDQQLALALRTMPTDLVDAIAQDVLERGLVSALADNSEEWSDVGWTTIARAWSVLSKPRREKLREALLQAIPKWQIAAASSAASELIPRETLEVQLAREVETVYQDIADASRGIFTGRSAEPATSIAWLSYRLGILSEAARDALVKLAIDSHVESSERQAALAALAMLARKGMLDAKAAEPALAPMAAAASSFMVDDAPADQRYENLQRISLQVTLSYSDAHDGRLLAASRDPNVRVRHLAVSTVRLLSLDGSASPALDGALLGALYDPDPSIQAAVMPAIWRGKFASPIVRDAARLRVVELWSSAPLELRLTIAKEVAIRDTDNEQLLELAAKCSLDRSLLVRAAATGV